MTTARFRCSACGEPLVRPVLSCPYCGAFRSAVALDGTEPPPPRADDVPETLPPEAAWSEPAEAPRPDERDVAGADEIHPHPDDMHPAEAPRDAAPDPAFVPPEPPMVEPVRAAPSPIDVAPAGPSLETGTDMDRDDADEELEEPYEEAAGPRPVEDRSVLGAVPGAGRAAEPERGLRAGRVEPTVSGGRQRPPLTAEPRRAGRLDRGAAGPPADDDATVEQDRDDDGAEVPREPAMPRAPSRRRRAEPELRRPVGEAAAAGSAWLASDARDTDGEEAPSIDDVLEEAEPQPRRRGRRRARDDYGSAQDDREKRRRGNGGWIALLLFLLVIAGGVAYAVYWIDKAGLSDLLRSPNHEVSSLGEASEVSVPGEWTTVPTPGAGGASEVLVSADGPFRMRVDGTVYTLDGSTAVRVPVKDSTLLELKALGNPVTASVTRLGNAAGAQ